MLRDEAKPTDIAQGSLTPDDLLSLADAATLLSERLGYEVTPYLLTTWEKTYGLCPVDPAEVGVDQVGNRKARYYRREDVEGFVKPEHPAKRWARETGCPNGHRTKSTHAPQYKAKGPKERAARRLRGAEMKASGMSDTQIAKAEGLAGNSAVRYDRIATFRALDIHAPDDVKAAAALIWQAHTDNLERSREQYEAVAFEREKLVADETTRQVKAISADKEASPDPPFNMLECIRVQDRLVQTMSGTLKHMGELVGAVKGAGSITIDNSTTENKVVIFLPDNGRNPTTSGAADDIPLVTG